MTPAEQQIIDEAERLRAENERLKRELTVANDTVAKMDGLTEATTRSVESLSKQLAAAKRREEQVAADVVALREFAQAQRTGARELSEDAESEYKESGYDGEAVAYGALLVKMDELETFREVK